MVANIANLMSRILQPSQSTSLRPTVAAKNENPFASPFLSQSASASYMTYGKNQPVKGGFFAGYYNGKANIVGRQLFIEA